MAWPTAIERASQHFAQVYLSRDALNTIFNSAFVVGAAAAITFAAHICVVAERELAAERSRRAAEATRALGVEPGQIAKTLSLKVGDQRFLLVTRGDARLDNAKAKSAFGGRASMLGADEAVRLTGHPIGGVCPFGLATPLPVFCDVSLREFEEVYPAAGDRNASVKTTPLRIAALTAAAWVDACRCDAPR